MGFFLRCYLSLTLLFSCGGHAQKVCVYMKDCPLIYELLKADDGQKQIEEIVCEKHLRYPKVWCKIPCELNSNEKGFCSLPSDCETTTESNNFCNINDSLNQYLCCHKKSDTNSTLTRNLIETTTIQEDTTINFTTNRVINLRVSQPDLDICGTQVDTVKVANGKIATMFDHPWSVLLQYLEKGKLVIKCGGVLVSDRFVLTAAHCLDISRAELLFAILGEYNVTNATDCFRGFCMPQPLKISIKNTAIHPDWFTFERPFYNDIALIELERKVEYNEFIRPICLNQIYEKSPNPLVVVGWGKTEFDELSDVKRVANLDLQPKSSCLNTVKIPLIESQLCVGGGLQDSCDGDSGGPLVQVDHSKSQPIWKLIGLVSLGTGKCGTIGKPGIYTNVSYYYDWIINKIT
ncbi:phenoloxidase-activating factor 3-like [Onthophagus taurus]|uniref:phenoloxidase-activating factor 3-like n=1 Tax=Onthophagus taurus TaxID=166361 RepID=UPI0039BE7E00